MPLQLRLAIISILLIITGIFTFTPFRSLPVIGLVLLLVFALFKKPIIPAILRSKSFLSFILLFFLFVVSLFNTAPENSDELVKQFFAKSPFLVFAFAFATLPKISKRQLLGIYYFFFLLVVACCIGTFTNYLLHFTEINSSYISSKIMPTPINHVRFSLATALAVFVGAYLYQENYQLKYKWERYLIVSSTIFLFFFIHILSVRSGLLSMYVVLIGILITAIVKGKQRIAIPFLLMLIILPVLSYYLVPTFKNKASNTIEDISHLGHAENANHFSISGRIVSYNVALDLFAQNPIFGTGLGNLEGDIIATYKNKYPAIYNTGNGILMPHNQFLLILTGMGIVGLLGFIIAFYLPLFINYNYKFPLLTIHYTIITISFLFEGTLETITGSFLSLVFIMLPIYYLRDKDNSQ